MCVEALETAGPGTGATDADLELGPEGTLLGMGAFQARDQLRIRSRLASPALDPTGRLETRDGRDQMRTGQPVGRGKRLACVVVRPLLGDSRPPERAADDDAPKRPRGPA